MASSYLQDPIAVVGMGCRLPGDSNSPHALWNLLEAGKCAANEPPLSRFDFKTHYDGSVKPKTMRSPGGMFLEKINPQDFDAAFFSISAADATAMDPQQRQLLEVVYECLENAGIPLHALDGADVGCFVGSYAVDYADMQSRDPDDRVPGVTVGVGRAILSNRLSHFLNIKGPSMTIDTACSGSLVSLDVACRYLQTREISGAIVAGANLYLSPEHVMDTGPMKGASSLTGKCHTWDQKADGYIKAEGINAVMLKRLDDAIRDGDPIRAVIRGTATNSDGRTPGIASPSSEAQAEAIRAAYRHAGITNLEDTTYLECHGTGTQAGDPTALRSEARLTSIFFSELKGAASVLCSSPRKSPLLIGSVKSNIGHSEPAAGISGLMKAILTLENKVIPGNPTFITPSDKIDFEALQVKASRYSVPWPSVSIKRASVNSFGYGGSNVHCVVDAFDRSVHKSSYRTSDDFDDFFAEDTTPNGTERTQLLVFSANDEASLREYASRLSGHLMNPNVSVQLADLAYTLSERRSRLFHRGYLLAKTASAGLDTSNLVVGKPGSELPRIGFVFTGQGAQWSQMGKELLQTFPEAREVVKRLDKVLQSTPNPPSWSLLSELTEPRSPKALRRPEFSQPLVTALQIAMVHVLRNSWGVSPQAVVGHSSGEIAAAYTAGYLSESDAIKAAFYRGQAALEDSVEDVGMLAAGLGPAKVAQYLAPFEDSVQIACYNSPDSVTLSGLSSALEQVRAALVEDGHFARMLQVNLAYHSKFMNKIGDDYETLLHQAFDRSDAAQAAKNIIWYSSVSGEQFLQGVEADAAYWKANMTSPVRFHPALHEMISGKTGCNYLIEIGPSGALAGPVAQIKNSIAEGVKVEYCAALTRGQDAINAMYEVAGRLFIAGAAIDLAKVNSPGGSSTPTATTIVDLPNYAWNHSTKYWYESDASRDWRYRMFPHHDLIGSKVLGTLYHAPVWRKSMAVEDLPWLRDHKMGPDIVFPAAGFIAMAIEGIRQITEAQAIEQQVAKPENPRYRVRNITFPRALVLEEGKPSSIMTSMSKAPGTTSPWYEFKIHSKTADVWNEHCRGLVCIEQLPSRKATAAELAPLLHTSRGDIWYKALSEVGYGFGPAFQKHLRIECTSGQRNSRSIVDLSEPKSAYPQSPYPMHPASIDACLQTGAPALWNGNRSSINAVLIPAIIDDLVVCSPPAGSTIGEAVSIASAHYVGIGRPDQTKNYMGNSTVYEPESGAMLFRVKGLRFHKLDMDQDELLSHKYTRLQWAPDVDFLSEKGLNTWLRATSATSENRDPDLILDLLAHKKPSSKVAEICLLPGSFTSTWLDGDESGIRQCCRKFLFLSPDAKAVVSAQEKYAGHPGATFTFFDPVQFGAEGEVFDIVILRLRSKDELEPGFMHKVRESLGGEGKLLLIQDPSDAPIEARTSVIQSLEGGGMRAIAVGRGGSASGIYLAATRDEDTELPGSRPIELVHSFPISSQTRSIVDSLKALGWSVSERSLADGVSPDSKDPVLILDELAEPLISKISSDQWDSLKELFTTNRPILWVTEGSQMQVTEPEKAMIHGLCRTVRAEDPLVWITTLDVQRRDKDHTASTISTVLDHIQQGGPLTEHEFVERENIIHISRVLPNTAVNQMSHERTHGRGFEDMKLHDQSTTVRLIAERLGTLDALQYNEIGEIPLGPNRVEVEVEAAGLNFKDLAITMGIVPENEHLLGLEGAGTVRRPGSTSYNVGDRVLVFEKGTFANRVIATTERVYPIPDWMSFEEAATLASVYLVSLYSLYDLANVQPGQRVLIHSATGGLGVACIQICQYIGVEIYATAGSEEKRKFLESEFKIPATNIFNSRTIEFAEQLMDATNQEGVDCIINSLTGDLLDESWRCIREGGTMVELGKKDMLDRNFLSMETFGRNVSYRCFDMAHKNVSDPMIARLLKQLMPLVEQKILTPIRPIKTFGFDEIPEAFRYMRGSNHMGKIVISNQTQEDVIVKARPTPRVLQLKPDVSYLIVGGLKGLCGSLAIQLARRGAKSIIAMARSGYADDVSQATIKSVQSEGAEVQLMIGDVSKLEDVRAVFSAANRPIAGIVQGAMVLRDKIFASMSIKDFHDGVTPKVTGTWNLHKIALEQTVDLDFFTMLSSISGVVGQRGQAQYAAANVFLDAFAAYRRQVLGLRANSVDLGAVEDVGYVSRNTELLQIFDPATWTPINEPLLLDIVEQSILQQVDKTCPDGADEAQLITGIAVPLGGDSPLLSNDARFSGLSFGMQSDALASGDGVDKELATLLLLVRSPATDAINSQVLDLCVEVVNRQFQKILRLSEPMEPAKNLNSYGLDSLAAVELRNFIRKDLSADLTTLDITNATSLIALCEKVVAKMQAVQ